MVNVLDRKLLRDLYRSKSLLVAITLIITVGVMCFVTMQTSYHNLTSAKSRYYQQCRMADFWIEAKKIPLADIDDIRQLPGVAQVDTRVQFYATVDIEASVKPINGLVASLPNSRTTLINDILIQQGDYFSKQRENEVIVSDKFARQHRLFPGSRIHLLLNNRRQELIVAGTAISSEFTYLLGPGALLPDPESFGVFYVKRSYAEDIFDFEGGANLITGRFSPNLKQNSAVLLEQMEDRLDDYGIFSTYELSEQASNQFLTNEIDGLKSFASVMPTIFLLVAALILNVMLSRLVRQQRTTIGTLKAIGYSDGTIFIHFLKLGFVVGVVGSVVGSVSGFYLAAAMTVVYEQYFEFPDLCNEFHFETHLIGLIASLTCALSGSFFAARSALRLVPAEAMRPAPPQSGRAILLERITWFWQHLSSAWRSTLRGLSRHWMRTSVAIFAAAMGSALLVTGFMMIAAQNFLIDFQFHRVSRSDVDLTFGDEISQDSLSELKRLSGVDRVEPLLSVSCTLVNGPYRKKIAIQGVSPDATLSVPRDPRGEPIGIPESGLVLDQRIAATLQVLPGDELMFTPVSGEKLTQVVRVAKLTDSFLGLSANADIGYVSRLIGESDIMNGAQLAVDSTPAHRVELYRQLKQMSNVRSINDRQQLTQVLTDTLLQNQLVMIGMLVFFSSVIFLGSILNASLVSLAERQSQVAMFRALGYGEWEIGLIFLRESVCTNSIGTLLGLPLGYLLTVLMSQSFSTDLIRLPIVWNNWIAFATITLAIIFTSFAQTLVQRTINTMDFMDALKNKE